MVGASKGDIRPQTPVTFLDSTVSHQGGQGGPRKPQPPHYVETRDIENAAEPASDQQGQPKDDKQVESGTGSGFDYARALRETFNRPGCTEFDDEDEFETDDIGNTTVRNPQRRRERLAAGYRERINGEPTPFERRRVTELSLLEVPNEEVRVLCTSGIMGSARFAKRPGPNTMVSPISQRHTCSNVTMHGGSMYRVTQFACAPSILPSGVMQPKRRRWMLSNRSRVFVCVAKGAMAIWRSTSLYWERMSPFATMSAICWRYGRWLRWRAVPTTIECRSANLLQKGDVTRCSGESRRARPSVFRAELQRVNLAAFNPPAEHSPARPPQNQSGHPRRDRGER